MEVFVVEVVDLGNLVGFVVVMEDGDVGGVLNFEGDKEGDGFNGVVVLIYVVFWEVVSILIK